MRGRIICIEKKTERLVEPLRSFRLQPQKRSIAEVLSGRLRLGAVARKHEGELVGIGEAPQRRVHVFNRELGNRLFGLLRELPAAVELEVGKLGRSERRILRAVNGA